MKHRHKFVDHLDFAVGYWAKRECPGDGFKVLGKIQHCSPNMRGEHCDAMQFIPAVRGWRAVECEGSGDGIDSCRQCGKPYLECKDAYQ